MNEARAALPPTLVAALRAARGADRWSVTFLTARLEPREWSWAMLARAAERRAVSYRMRGASRGDRVAIALIDEENFVLAFLGAVRAGLVPVPLCPPSRFGNIDSEVRRVVGVIDKAAVRWLLGEPELRLLLTRVVESAAASLELIEQGSEADCETTASTWVDDGPDPEPDDLCFLQFTSGSTAEPKGVRVTHRNLVANVEALHARLRSDATCDVGVNWTPLYHDMGLIGSVVTPLLSLGKQVFIPTAAFAARPSIWLETVHRFRGTMLNTNNFGLRAALRRPPRDPNLDLSCVRVLTVAAEPIHASTLVDFVQRYAPYGLAPEAINPAYGLAEATLAICAKRPGQRYRVIDFDPRLHPGAEELSPVVPKADGARTTPLVSCGEVVAEHELAIMDPNGRSLPEGHVGEIVVHGPSVTGGYFRDPASTAAALRGAWLHTGDLGLIDQGELFVCGRQKDLIILAGRNYHPQPIEWAVGRVPGLRFGHVAAFSVPGRDTERLVLVSECDSPHRTEGLEHAVRRAAIAETGIGPDEIVFVLPSTLPKTTSGKLQRGRIRDAFLNQLLRRVPASEIVESHEPHG